MILKSIKLNNIRSYKDISIEFPTGSVLLAGDIGAGKSTILLAIEFALFGIRRPDLPGNAILQHGKNTGEVILNLKIENKNISIKRTLKRQGKNIVQDKGYIIIDGKKTEGTTIELKSKILNLLGYPKELVSKSKSLIYRYTVYTPQEELKKILYEENEIRLNTLRTVFGIDKYKKIRENALIFNRELKRKKSEHLGSISDLDEKYNQKKERLQQIKEIEIDTEKINPELKNLKEKRKSKKELIKKVEEIISKISKYKNKIDILTNKIDFSNKRTLIIRHEIKTNDEKIKTYSKKIEEIKIDSFIDEKTKEDELNLIETKSKILEKELQIDRIEYSRLQQENKNLTDEINELSISSKENIVIQAKISQIVEKIKNLPELEKEQNVIIEDIKSIEEKIFESKLSIDSSKKIISSINNLNNCPTCKQGVPVEHKHEIDEKEISKQKELSSQISHLNEKKKSLDIKKNDLLKNITILTTLEKESISLKEKEKHLKISTNKLIDKQKLKNDILNKIKTFEEKFKDNPEIKLDTYKEKVEQIKSDLKKIRELNTKYREKKNIIERINESKNNIENFKKENSKLEQEIIIHSKNKSELISKISKYDRIDEKHKILKDQNLKLEEEIRLYEIKLAQLNQEKKSNIQTIQLLDDDIKRKEKTKKKIDYLNDLQNWLEKFFVNLMTMMEKQIMMSIYHEFNELLKEWFSILIEDIDIKLNQEFSPILIQNGYETDINNLSGGEKTSVALAYRLALNKVINNMIKTIKSKDFIILDEPTDGFSTDMLDKVRDILEQMDMKQVIIVSHEPKLESMVENVIRISKDDHVSSVV
ncbi:SMC family ATPase [archaeon]|mgnify:FL=1|jgi:DNA repair protein SbcC/Rad50|nr:SMC family ATPase [archaeon]MBT6822456.1 SMC family ATPase [archaeon]MBT7392094.1 SMC family ATPase [archaeon]